jgi:hypothetical protein
MGGARVLTSVTGERLVIREATPARLRFDLYSPPRQPAPPRAAHPTQVESFAVLEGRLRATVESVTRDYGPGERFVIPAGAYHVVRNAADASARAAVAFFEELTALRRLTPLGLARLVKRHRDAIRLAPPFAQLLAFLGPFVRA